MITINSVLAVIAATCSIGANVKALNETIDDTKIIEIISSRLNTTLQIFVNTTHIITDSINIATRRGIGIYNTSQTKKGYN